MSGTTDWDAKTYDRLAAPQEDWARDVLARLPLEGNETVLAAGCGSGRVTRLLAERLPKGRVIAVDGSKSMIEQARERLGELGDRVELVHSDLLELELEEPVDAVFSNAAFPGFDDVRCWLEERIVEPEDSREYVAVVGLAAHHELLPDELRESFTDAVDEELPEPPRAPLRPPQHRGPTCRSLGAYNGTP